MPAVHRRNYWLVDRKSLASARTLDLRYASPQELAFIAIWSANGARTRQLHVTVSMLQR
jgi:hypothetical protein